jgi:hypothetical protein
MKRQSYQAAYPVVTLGAKYLVMGHLLRRNILASRAPIRRAAYDLICSHPVLRRRGRLIRVQVKCRLASDCARDFPVQPESLDPVDFLVLVFLNIGDFYHRHQDTPARSGARDAEFFTFPVAFIREHLRLVDGEARVETGGLDIERFRNEAGFEQIAAALDIPYPD